MRLLEGGSDILAGEVTITTELAGGSSETAVLQLPPGHPDSPATDADLAAKVEACVGTERAAEVTALLRRTFPVGDDLAPG